MLNDSIQINPVARVEKTTNPSHRLSFFERLDRDARARGYDCPTPESIKKITRFALDMLPFAGPLVTLYEVRSLMPEILRRNNIEEIQKAERVHILALIELCGIDPFSLLSLVEIEILHLFVAIAQRGQNMRTILKHTRNRDVLDPVAERLLGFSCVAHLNRRLLYPKTQL